jgi:hypothetical protein
MYLILLHFEVSCMNRSRLKSKLKIIKQITRLLKKLRRSCINPKNVIFDLVMSNSMYMRIPLYSCANITELSENYSSLYKKMHNKRERYNLPWHSFIIKDDIEYSTIVYGSTCFMNGKPSQWEYYSPGSRRTLSRATAYTVPVKTRYDRFALKHTRR